MQPGRAPIADGELPPRSSLSARCPTVPCARTVPVSEVQGPEKRFAAGVPDLSSIPRAPGVGSLCLSNLLAFLGATIGGWLGWWLGASVGFMTAFLVSVVGTAVGVYVGRRLADGLLT